MRATVAVNATNAMSDATKAAAAFLKQALDILAEAEAAGSARRSQPTRYEECQVASAIKQALEATPFDHASRAKVQAAFDAAWAIITA